MRQVPGPFCRMPCLSEGSHHQRPLGERDDPADAAGSSMVQLGRAPLVIAAATAVGDAGVRRMCSEVPARAGARRPASRDHRHARLRIRSAGARSRRRPGSQSQRHAARQKRPADRRPGAVARAFAAAGCQRVSSTGLSPFSAPPRRRRRLWSWPQTCPDPSVRRDGFYTRRRSTVRAPVTRRMSMGSTRLLRTSAHPLIARSEAQAAERRSSRWSRWELDPDLTRAGDLLGAMPPRVGALALIRQLLLYEVDRNSVGRRGACLHSVCVLERLPRDHRALAGL